MKILLCSHTGVYKGGAERSLLFLAQGLAQRDMKLIITIPDKSQELLKELAKYDLDYVTIYKDDDKRSIHDISFLDRYLKFSKRIFYTFKMYLFIKTNNIDVVYLNTLRTTSEYIAAKIAGKKTVMHIRGFDIKSNFRYPLLSQLNKIITLNPSAKKIISNKIWSFKSENIVIIPNGVTIHELEDKKFNKKTTKIVFLGGYEHRKGIDLFFEIASALLTSDVNIQIFHIGDSTPKDDFSEKILNKHSLLRGHKNFIELGFVDNVSAIIDDFDFFLTTSRSEGMPRSLLESMERGLIPIVSDINELTSVIKDSYNGFIIDTNNIENCIYKIKKIVNNKKQLDYISKNARNDVLTNYNLENTNAKIIDTLTKWD